MFSALPKADWSNGGCRERCLVMTAPTTIDRPWPMVLRRYILLSAGLHIVWETAQLPLYSVWSEPIGKRIFAVLHCTIGDMMIAGLSLLAALAVVGQTEWPNRGARQVWFLLVGLGLGYTVYSEWLNVNVRGSWAYDAAMPTLPLLGTGLGPLLQWLVVPTLTLLIAVGRPPWRSDRTQHREETPYARY